MQERLQKIISASGLASRREAERLISAGKVYVNGSVAQIGDRADPEIDEITVDGKLLPVSAKKLYIALNKPCGYITTVHDDRGRKTIMELVKDIKERIYPVGRLDMDSSGLILLTNDGDFANKVMHPSSVKNKIYHVKVTGDVVKALPMLNSSMLIDGYRISPAKAVVLQDNGTSHVLEITIHEGRNRQIRKMCDIAGLKVRSLNRVSIGEVSLGELKAGAWRYLTTEEINSFFNSEI